MKKMTLSNWTYSRMIQDPHHQARNYMINCIEMEASLYQISSSISGPWTTAENLRICQNSSKMLEDPTQQKIIVEAMNLMVHENYHPLLVHENYHPLLLDILDMAERGIIKIEFIPIYRFGLNYLYSEYLSRYASALNMREDHLIPAFREKLYDIKNLSYIL